MIARPLVSVVVPFLGSEPELERLVEALEQIEVAPGDELIVADNRSTVTGPRGTGRVSVHPAGGLRSPGFARNRGAAAATGEWLVFIDADTEPEPGLLDGYFDPLPATATAILGGRIVDVPTLSPSSRTLGPAARHAAARRHMDDQVTLSRSRFAYAQTANCAVRRTAFTAVGGFAEGVRAGEDADLCFRLAEQGWRLESRRGATVGHRTRATLAESLAQLSRHGSGAAWCNRRYPGSFPPPTPWGLTARLGRGMARALGDYARGDRENASFAALEVAEAAAFELGRLLPNRARRGA